MSRRGENIRKRKDGRWEARYIKGHNKDGSIKYGYVYDKTYKKVREKKLACIQTLKENNITEDTVNLQHLASKWLIKKSFTVKSSTYAYYNTIILTHFAELWQDKSVYQVTSTDIEQFIINLLKKNLKPSTIHSITDILRFILKSALPPISSEIIEKCYFHTSSPSVKVCEGTDRKKIEQALFKRGDSFCIGILLMLYTGMRVGELCGLQWKNFDFDNNTISIERTVQRIHNIDALPNEPQTKIHIGPPKTTASLRKIPIPSHLKPLLQNNHNIASYYIINNSDKVMEPRSVQKRFKSFLKKENLNYYNLHAIRHGFATTAIEKGADCKSVSSILGHSSTKTTLDIYVHSSQKQMQSCIDSL